MGEQIKYRSRIEFKAKFGRAVTPDPKIQKLKHTLNLDFIPSSSFRLKFDQRLKHLCETDAVMASIVWQASEYIISQDSKNSKIKTNDNFDQNLCQQLHDTLLEHLDNKIIILAHLIKISNFMPSLSKIYNGVFCHLITIDGIPEHIQSLNFSELEDKDYLLSMINQSIESVFPMLQSLRQQFTPETQKHRKSRKCKDEFSRKFNKCKEVQIHDMPDRLEYLFFESYKIPLGITPIRNKKVTHYLGKKQCHDTEQRHVYADIKSGKLASKFPGITLSQQQKNTLEKAAFRRSFTAEMQHIIPKTGIVLG